MIKNRGTLPVSRRERLVTEVYSSMDEAITGRLNRLWDEEKIQPACRIGCCHCCRFHILTNMAEAYALVRYIKREWNGDQINQLRHRTRLWHAWDQGQPGRKVSKWIDFRLDLAGYEDVCPLLIDGACSVYPVRPGVCRSHYVSTSPLACQAMNHPGSPAASPVTLASVVEAADPYSLALRGQVEAAGWDYQRTLMLLPHWLAVGMEWDFGVSL